MDVERTNSETKAKGFRALAERIARGPDHEIFIFRRFDQLSARNIINLESRLAYLESKLEVADQIAEKSEDITTLISTECWEGFESSADDPVRPEHGRMKLVKEISHALKEYHEALIRQSQIAVLDDPRERALQVALHLSSDDEYDDLGIKKTTRRPLVYGVAGERLAVENHPDLVAVRRPVESDVLSRLLQDHWMFKKVSQGDGTTYIAENHVRWAAAVISTLVAAILLLGAIVLLRVFKSESAQQGMIAMFVVLFSASVRVLTNARRAEIFAATAAYAAVLVVFISSSASDSGSSVCQCGSTNSTISSTAS